MLYLVDEKLFVSLVAFAANYEWQCVQLQLQISWKYPTATLPPLPGHGCCEVPRTRQNTFPSRECAVSVPVCCIDRLGPNCPTICTTGHEGHMPWTNGHLPGIEQCFLLKSTKPLLLYCADWLRMAPYGSVWLPGCEYFCCLCLSLHLSRDEDFPLAHVHHQHLGVL